MKQGFYTSGLVFLVMICICIFTGCTDSKESNNNKSMPAASETSDWPDDLPKFEYGKLMHILNDENTGVLKSAVFGSITNPETAYENYKTALIDSGWVFEEDGSNEYVWDCDYSKGSRNAHVTIQKDGSAAQILYIAS